MFQFFSKNRWQAFLRVIIVGVSHFISLVFAPWIWCFGAKSMLFVIGLTFWSKSHIVIYGLYRFLYLLCVALITENCITIICLHAVYSWISKSASSTNSFAIIKFTTLWFIFVVTYSCSYSLLNMTNTVLFVQWILVTKFLPYSFFHSPKWSPTYVVYCKFYISIDQRNILMDPSTSINPEIPVWFMQQSFLWNSLHWSLEFGLAWHMWQNFALTN